MKTGNLTWRNRIHFNFIFPWNIFSFGFMNFPDFFYFNFFSFFLSFFFFFPDFLCEFSIFFGNFMLWDNISFPWNIFNLINFPDFFSNFLRRISQIFFCNYCCKMIFWLFFIFTIPLIFFIMNFRDFSAIFCDFHDSFQWNFHYFVSMNFPCFFLLFLKWLFEIF